ncbi:hypothetical protein QGN29_12005 [Temperatibacter marinus]|uniref:Tetratricopeptide repeat protein n=1 Tax=Temperatibacter marinus TaxID=1456591 RepID=A0AA52H8M5_9PROT|nr:hypothetical protein [Temperatibacter marinus]WND02271.1 hypothetical protein QGN29_12005 [Temperatibacter marinus]
MKKSMKYSLLAFLGLLLSACSEDSLQKTTEKDAGPVAARALNEMARKSPESLIRIAYALETAGNYTEALDVYNQAKAADGTLIRPDIGIARIYLRYNKRDEAFAQVKGYLGNSALSSALKEELAKLFLDMQAYDEALTFIEPISELSSGRVISLAGILQELKGNGFKARMYYERAADLEKANPERFSKLMAYSFALDGSFETAVALLQPALNNPASMKEARESLAYIYALSGQLKPAEALLSNIYDVKYAKERRTLFMLMPLMTRTEKIEALLFERIRPDTLKRLMPAVDLKN